MTPMYRTADGTRKERTGWRDEEISTRHRMWGFNCPAVDLDFVLVEYNVGLPVALIEYKRFTAPMPNFQHPTHRALSDLATHYKMTGLPYACAFYWPETWAMRVYPVNDIAKRFFEVPYEDFDESSYVIRLYQMRNLVIEDGVLPQLNTAAPPKSRLVAVKASTPLIARTSGR